MTKSNLACIQRVISKGPLFLKSFSMLQNNKIQLNICNSECSHCFFSVATDMRIWTQLPTPTLHEAPGIQLPDQSWPQDLQKTRVKRPHRGLDDENG